MNNASSITTLLFAVVALTVVLALAWLLLKGLAALGQRGSANSPMRIKATLPLGSRERLMVVEYKDNDYLLGVSSGNITKIDQHAALGPETRKTSQPT